MMQMSLSSLSLVSQTVVNQYAIRKDKQQKEEFRQYALGALQKAGWKTQIDSTGKILPSNNIVAGNPSTASILLTAHYDTPARLPFPNFLTPRNLLGIILYQLFLLFAIVLLPFLLSLGFLFATGNVILGFYTFLVLTLVLTIFLVAGPANPNNANDNTSGVLVLLETALALPAEMRSDVALVFFDNEELGMFGSAAHIKQYGRLANQTVLNFDCVGVGDTFLFAQSKACRKSKELQQQLSIGFATLHNKTVLLDTSPFTFFPSDQLMFRQGIGISALKSHPFIGFYINHVHTKKDIVLQSENILALRNGIIHFIAIQK